VSPCGSWIRRRVIAISGCSIQDRGTNTRFTFDPGADNNPQWSPDGRQIAFSSDRNGGVPNLYTKDASGTGSEQLLYGSAAAKAPSSWSADGRYLAYQAQDPLTGVDVLVLPMFGDKKPIPFLHSNFTEAQPRFSPDGKYIAYTCDESGRFEVYVQEFPGPGGKWQVSTRGGVQPRWRADGHELYYLTLDGKMMASTIDENGGFRAGVPAQLFDSHIQSHWRELAIRGIRRRPAVPAGCPTAARRRGALTVVLNWNAELKKR
jgi:Tol biopolymer transport system component